MKFVIDAQLPRRLALRLLDLKHEAVHTLELPDGNRTPDQSICAYADAEGAAVVTKDADFIIHRALSGSPQRLLVVATGNISNALLVQFIETHLPAIASALAMPGHLELTRNSLIIRN